MNGAESGNRLNKKIKKIGCGKKSCLGKAQGRILTNLFRERNGGEIKNQIWKIYGAEPGKLRDLLRFSLPGNLRDEDPGLHVEDADAAGDAGHRHHGVPHALARVHARGVRRARFRQLKQLPWIQNIHG